ncbi:MAG: hypothetical protein ABEJ86_04920 [Halococcoides sp.]
MDSDRRWRWGPVGAIAAAILAASLIDPGIAGPPSTGPFGALAVTTWMHLLGYTALTAALLAAIDHPYGVVIAPLAAIGFGAGIELLQWPLAYRNGTLADAAVNAVAALTMTALWPACRRIRTPSGRDADRGSDD